jgi:hypothetical protein
VAAQAISCWTIDGKAHVPHIEVDRGEPAYFPAGRFADLERHAVGDF